VVHENRGNRFSMKWIPNLTLYVSDGFKFYLIHGILVDCYLGSVYLFVFIKYFLISVFYSCNKRILDSE